MTINDGDASLSLAAAAAASTCSDSCGWAAALIALIAFGTYGVPIKETRHVENLHPLILQTYKTIVMVLVCPAVLLLPGIKASFTPWGLLSGVLWVLGGTGGVVAVRWAGMATAVGTWSSVMICVNFVWGILVFHEPVARLRNTVAAFGLLGCGLIGMSKYGAPTSSSGNTVGNTSISSSSSSSSNAGDTDHNSETDLQGTDDTPETLALSLGLSNRSTTSTNNNNNNSLSDIQSNKHANPSAPITRFKLLRRSRSDVRTNVTSSDDETEAMIDSIVEGFPTTNTLATTPTFNTETHVCIGAGIVLRKRAAGILGAVWNGLLAGSSLIPLHYAKQHGFGGIHYFLSYAIGAFTANLSIWAVYYAVLLFQEVRKTHVGSHVSETISRSTSASDVASYPAPKQRGGAARAPQRAYDRMPELHLRQLWKPGVCAGLLITTAMFGSILSVTYLGQGIGNSVVQAKIIISGMWGIFYYKEISDPRAIRRWFLSACLTISGIIWLSQERIAAKMEDHRRRF